MTTFTDVSSLIAANKPITYEQGLAFYYNVIALLEGDASLPRLIDNAALDPIVPTTLNLASSSLAGTITAGSRATIDLDSYAFFPRIKQTDGTLPDLAVKAKLTGNSPGFSLENDGGADRYYNVAWDYIAP